MSLLLEYEHNEYNNCTVPGGFRKRFFLENYHFLYHFVFIAFIEIKIFIYFLIDPKTPNEIGRSVLYKS